MKTVFVGGSDTNVGKTWATAAIASHLLDSGHSVQVVKPVETGVGELRVGDVDQIRSVCDSPGFEGYTLQTFREPVAPALASKLEGRPLQYSELLVQIEALPTDADWRLVEGAGSLATPVSEDGADWGDFASALNAEATVLVVENRVGAIGQARMVYAFGLSKKLRCGIWLNEIKEQSTIEKESSLSGIENLGIPIWGLSGPGKAKAESIEAGWL